MHKDSNREQNTNDRLNPRILADRRALQLVAGGGLESLGRLGEQVALDVVHAQLADDLEL